MTVRTRVFLAVVGLFILTIVSVISSGANPIAKAHSLSAVRLNSLFTGNDPLAPRYLLLDDAVREYASMAGRFASPAQMAQDGFLPFVLSSGDGDAQRAVLSEARACSGPGGAERLELHKGEPIVALGATTCTGGCECINLPTLQIDAGDAENATCPCGTNCQGTRRLVTYTCREDIPDPICTGTSGPKDCYCSSGTLYYWNCCTGTEEGQPCHGCYPCSFHGTFTETSRFEYRCPGQLCLSVDDC